MGITACLRNLEQKVLISEAQNLCNELGLFDFDENPYSPPPQIFRYSLCSKAFKNVSYFTGVPKKDLTSETTVRNLYCMFLYIHDSLQL